MAIFLGNGYYDAHRPITADERATRAATGTTDGADSEVIGVGAGTAFGGPDALATAAAGYGVDLNIDGALRPHRAAMAGAARSMRIIGGAERTSLNDIVGRAQGWAERLEVLVAQDAARGVNA